MKELFRSRYIALIVVVCCMFVILLMGLFTLQWRDGAEYAAEAVSGLDKKLRLTGDRGMIMDRNGVPLAYDQNSYNVVFFKDPGKSLSRYGAVYTEIIRKTVDIIEQGGEECVSKFNIVVSNDEDGSLLYRFYFPGIGFYTEENFEDGEVPHRVNRWLGDMRISSTDRKKLSNGEIRIENIYWMMRERYNIPADVSFDEAHKVLSVWQEVQMSSYRSYTPVVIAYDVSFDTVATIEMLSLELSGMEIQQSNIRIYPKNDLACHIVGYMGRMLDEATILEYEAIGYSRDDLIGISGIEAKLEFELSANMEGKTGYRIVEVNSRGKVINEKEISPPTDGNNVILTIDADMQKRLEEALEYNIKQINSVQTSEYNGNKEYYDDLLNGRELKKAEIGAAVVMNVNSGSILAMASYPSYDPNLFTGGLSQESADLLYGDTRNPLFNKAISSRSTPGSIFKMATAVAGLMEGVITLDTRITDEGPWSDEPQAPACWVAPRFYKHENQSVADGLKNSCNYFFFTVADELGSDRLNEWAAKLGLSSKTNVELTGEFAGQVASQPVLYTPGQRPTGLTAVVFNSIRKVLIEACVKQGFEYDDEQYDKVTYNLMDLVVAGETTEWGPDVRGILKNELELDAIMIRNFPNQSYDQQIISFMLEIKWDTTKNVLTGIGQSVTLLTPIGVARYISALVNGGNVYEASLIKSIISPDGQVINENRPQLIRSLGINPEYIDEIKKGMEEVVSADDGTASQYFSNFQYIELVAGKTGTAEVGNIDLENNAWFVAFAPYEQPEIAVVVMIPQGYSGGRASYTAREIIEYYLDEKLVKPEAPKIPDVNTITR